MTTRQKQVYDISENMGSCQCGNINASVFEQYGIMWCESKGDHRWMRHNGPAAWCGVGYGIGKRSRKLAECDSEEAIVDAVIAAMKDGKEVTVRSENFSVTVRLENGDMWVRSKGDLAYQNCDCLAKDFLNLLSPRVSAVLGKFRPDLATRPTWMAYNGEHWLGRYYSIDEAIDAASQHENGSVFSESPFKKVWQQGQE